MAIFAKKFKFPAKNSNVAPNLGPDLIFWVDLGGIPMTPGAAEKGL